MTTRIGVGSAQRTARAMVCSYKYWMTDQLDHPFQRGPFSPPENVNHLYTNKYKLVFLKIPSVTFFCLDAILPEVSLEKIPIGTPFNPHFVGGTSLAYADLAVRFRVDEDLKNYREIYRWMQGITSPTEYDEFANLVQTNSPSGIRAGYHIHSDARLLTLKNSHLFNMEIAFRDCFPIRLTGISFNNHSNAPVTADATFRYNYYEFVDG